MSGVEPAHRIAPAMQMVRRIGFLPFEGSSSTTSEQQRRVRCLDQLHRDRGGFAAADAEACDAALESAVLQRGDQRRRYARAAGADRMAERGCTAVHVDLLV